jgi:hypothetical protein
MLHCQQVTLHASGHTHLQDVSQTPTESYWRVATLALSRSADFPHPFLLFATTHPYLALLVPFLLPSVPGWLLQGHGCQPALRG